MAGIDLGGTHGGRRSNNQELPLIPFIDFLLCLVAFLLVTAVWSQMARVSADARVPGPPSNPSIDSQPERELHVEMRGERTFQLAAARLSRLARVSQGHGQKHEQASCRAKRQTVVYGQPREHQAKLLLIALLF